MSFSSFIVLSEALSLMMRQNGQVTMSEQEYKDLMSFMRQTEQAFLQQTESVRRLLQIYGINKKTSNMT